ncbi:hypothetical protein [Paraburkholderia metrosideri]|uniref:hypothetical protein n=1 Tax=Paraburkholderia metrosideri TaxID=580937 RepID=UPI001919CB90|nr:hypothetical protein [Paraburkholderia metrosideri]
MSKRSREQNCSKGEQILDDRPAMNVSLPTIRLMSRHRRIPVLCQKTNRFSHAYIHDSNKAYKRVALRDFNLQSYVSVASMLQIQKITEAVTYASLHSLKFRTIARPDHRARRRDRLIFYWRKS